MTRLLKRKDVTNLTTLQRSAIYQKMAAGEFPRQVKLGPKSVGWVESEISQWIEERVAARDASNGGGQR